MNWTMEQVLARGINRDGTVRQAQALPKQRLNKWEQEYAQELESRRLFGDHEIHWWGFEAVKLRLADSTWYTPDFAVIRHYQEPTGIWCQVVEFHEVKGFWRDDALVKFKVAAELFPWATFKAFRKRKVREGGGWEQIR